MFNKVLVALDSSEIGKIVFDEALALAKPFMSNLMLLHVISFEEKNNPNMLTFPNLAYYPGLSGRTLELYQEQWKSLEKYGLELLRKYANEATAVGVSTEYTHSFGSPGKTICNLARNWEADLIIMGRRGHVGLSELFLGSVSNYVLHHAPCSVLAVQHTEKKNTQSVTDQASGVVAVN